MADSYGRGYTFGVYNVVEQPCQIDMHHALVLHAVCRHVSRQPYTNSITSHFLRYSKLSAARWFADIAMPSGTTAGIGKWHVLNSGGQRLSLKATLCNGQCFGWAADTATPEVYTGVVQDAVVSLRHAKAHSSRKQADIASVPGLTFPTHKTFPLTVLTLM